MIRLSSYPKSGLPLALSFSALLLSVAPGCGTDHSKDVLAPGEDTAYQKAACEFGYEQGADVDFSLSARDIQTPHFGKMIDMGPIHAVGQASARATVEYFNGLGVHIYQIPKSVAKCNMFSSIDPAPSDFQSFWNRETADESDSTGHVIGLYIEKGNPDLSSATSTAEIGIREDAYRWVVVHEFSHHQFESMATANGRSPSVLKDDTKRSLDKLSGYAAALDANPSKTTLVQASDAYAAFLVNMREFLVRFPLEEVTIESMLQTEFNSGRLGNTPFIQRSSDSYILSSATNALKLLSSFTDAGTDLMEKDVEKSAYDAANVVSKDLDKTRAMVVEIGDIVNSIAGQSSFILADRAALTAADEQEPARFHCAHEREASELNEKISRAAELFGKLARKHARN